MRYRFGQFALDTKRYELTREGEKRLVRPKVFDVLRYLVEHPDRLVTKQELLDALWVGQHVDGTSVPWMISHARRAVDQRSGDKTPIETVHSRGYRWRATLELDGEAPSPPVEAAHSAAPFVGRESLMVMFGDRLREVKAARGGMCLLVGDAGIGKTRCIDEISAVARAQGFAVWAGRVAPDSLAPVYFPWIALLRCARVDDVDGVAQALLSRLHAFDDGEARVADRDALRARFALFEAVSGFLLEHSRRVPLLLVLDDLHWADAGTVELLAFVAADVRNARVLLLGAERGQLVTVGARHSSQLLRNAERVDLGPLSVDSVAQYLDAATGTGEPLERELCEAVHRVSAGYPLFVQETLRGMLAQHGHEALASMPARSLRPSAHARDVLRGRLWALDDDVRRALAYASVLGERLELTALLRLADGEPDALLCALDTALSSGFLLADGVHCYRFRHALFREVVYEQMATGERLRCHRAAALMLQRSPDAAERKSEIAHHHYRALALGDPAQVCAAALDAAQAANRALSFADAAQFYEWALQALAIDPSASKREYAELLLQRAQAQRHGGSSEDARATIKQLVKIAAEHGYGDLLVQAARALRLSRGLGAVPDRLARVALERALELAPEGANELRLHAMSLLACLPCDARAMRRSKALSERALELARDLGNREVVIAALNARLYALSGPDDIDALLSVTDELLALDGEPRGWPSVEAHTARHGALLQRGDLQAAEAAIAAIADIATARGYRELSDELGLHWLAQQVRALPVSTPTVAPRT